MNKLLRYFVLGVALLAASLVVTAFDFDFFDTGIEAIDNPFTGDVDYIRSGNFTGTELIAGNLSITGNLTDIECIVWSNGAIDCGT